MYTWRGIHCFRCGSSVNVTTRNLCAQNFYNNFYIYYLWRRPCMYCGVWVEVRGQPVRIGSLLNPVWVPGIELRFSGWWQASSPAKLSHWPKCEPDFMWTHAFISQWCAQVELLKHMRSLCVLCVGTQQSHLPEPHCHLKEHPTYRVQVSPPHPCLLLLSLKPQCCLDMLSHPTSPSLGAVCTAHWWTRWGPCLTLAIWKNVLWNLSALMGPLFL